MTYVLNPSEQLAKKIEAKAAEQGIAPEEWFLRVAEKEAASEAAQTTTYASDEAFARAQQKVFDQYAKTFDALAEGAK